jgi:hypothetical protein
MRTPPRRAAAFLLATSAALLGVGAPALHVSITPRAHADRVVSVNDLCNGYKPGYVPMVAAFTMGEIICVAPGYFNPLPGLNDSNEGRVKPGNLPGLPPGSYRVNPFDPFSAWVIPG